MAKTLTFLVFMFVFVFASGFIAGYFLDRVGITYTQSEMDVLRNEIESMQLQEMFVSGEPADCKLIYSAMGKNSYDLYNLVDKLKTTSPDSAEFAQIKIDADLLSLRAWMIAKKVKKTCSADITPILFFYSENCPGCEEQDAVLKSIKESNHDVYVYAIDYGSDEQAINLVKAAYDINSTPSIIIEDNLFGRLSASEMEEIICENVSC